MNEAGAPREPQGRPRSETSGAAEHPPAPDVVAATRERALALDARFRELARSEPLLVAGVALAAGFVVGRIVSRR